jgi:alkanesulfonate monooxygenase SsuD/methylene tetrahydromethanopterin reductase-like flavin-dependent oxidoreductase (luciferase family)
MKPFRFGVQVSQVDSAAQWRDKARKFEDLGFSTLFMPDHFIDTALREVLACMSEGIEVRSYLYWSLLDNFEWALGYAPTFGLVGVDRQTFVRHPHPSLAWLGQVAKARALSEVEQSV